MPPENQPDPSQNPDPGNPNPNPVNPPTSLTKDDEIQLWKTAAQEANRRANDMTSRLDAIESRLSNPPPAPPPSADPNKTFFDTPVDIIRKELRETIAPLTQFKEEYTRNQTLQRVKEEFRNDPRFKVVFEKAEHLIDNAMSRIDPTRENLFSALLGIIGAEASGMLPGISFRAAQTPTPPTPPPQIPSSPSPLPGREPVKPKLRELTEAERSEVRRLRMTDEEYLKLLEAPSDGFMDASQQPPAGAPK